ncbi:putative ABC transport system permease protein [Nonomuraea solani]|uniref:Putative ABC transport system permease protein n=1 Tax=Nonomuraea solani TaxID=1144553 RepID=A0A1H6E8I6_9ACTN|nr:FtsX-like permease family protein [Nonomuraea solani]SEG94040.1 putative ABC transport system permease protein [Nonomuraea solani]
MSAFRAALRLSRRDSLRSKGRSALIMVMIGLPVLVITAMLTLSATTNLTLREHLPAQVGSVADAAIMSHIYRTPIRQDPSGSYGDQDMVRERPPAWTTAEVTKLVGGRLLPFYAWSTEVRLADGFDRVELLEIDLRDPLTKGLRTLTEGRLPAAAGEIAVSPALLDRGVRVGDTLKLSRRGVPKRVVGVVEHPIRPGYMEVVGLLDGVLPSKTEPQGNGWLARTPAPVTWEDMRRLNQAGLRVASRAVIESPRAQKEYDRSPNQDNKWRWMAITGLLIVTETVLLAGPAFAVGLRRRRRELATIAAQGGSARHLRVIVLADGLVLGGVAALAGAVLGAGVGLAVVWVVARNLDWGYSPEVPWAQALGVAALGLLSALVAAVAPAIQAARQSPAQVLAGRPGEARDRAGRPLLGIVLVPAGVGLTLWVSYRSELAVVAASTVTLFGLIALTPWLVGRTGRLAARLPLPARLSVRDGARHRARTASAVAAVMAATMAAVTMGLGYNSEYAERMRVHRNDAPEGTLTVRATDIDDRSWSALRAAVEERLPGVSLSAGQETIGDDGRSLVAAVDTYDGTCSGRRCSAEDAFYFDVPIGDARLLALFQRRQDPQAAAALAAGKAVVFDPRLIRDGKISVTVDRLDAGRTTREKRIRVPAVLATPAEPRQGGVLLPPSVLTAAGYEVAERRLYAAYVPDDVERLARDLASVSPRAEVTLNRDEAEFQLAVFLAMALVGALILVLGGTFAATGLAVADMRRDLDTLSAVGGRPLTRRLVAAAQAAYIAGLGAVTGLAGGAVAGSALAQTMQGISFEARVAVPWLFLAALVLGLPLLAALLAGLFTRTRLVLARRVG